MDVSINAYGEVNRLSKIHNDKKLTENEVASLFTYFNKPGKLSYVEKVLSNTEDDNIKLAYLRNLLNSVPDLAYRFDQMNLSRDKSTSELSKAVEKLFKAIDENLKQMDKVSTHMKAASASVDRNLEVLDKVLNRLNKDSKSIGRNNETASVTRAKSYQSTSFEKVNEDNFGSPLTKLQGPRSVDSNSEVNALKFLNGRNFKNVPRYVAHDDNSIIIRPVCGRIDDQFRTSHTLQLLSLLKRIHELKIYHRDVRPENILLDTNNDTLILADWGSSIQYQGGKVAYEGTITFASPNILNKKFGFYVPKASDDLHSFVRTVYTLRNPSKIPTNSDENLELKAKVIREYWNDMLDVKLCGPLWTEMVNAAENEDYKTLEKCCYVFTK
ncbi:21051_t:CDS:2 [Dentiscutata erythropus]|uniref:21051_t:CDS:1 n=1 Tax=Dentiscutata erythropus TaxID=1348616 RepID=A0A9N9HI41_9GLOM|nr:21051_t:CDS:2 [Dentiscutata erythropus]